MAFRTTVARGRQARQEIAVVSGMPTSRSSQRFPRGQAGAKSTHAPSKTRRGQSYRFMVMLLKFSLRRFGRAPGRVVVVVYRGERRPLSGHFAGRAGASRKSARHCCVQNRIFMSYTEATRHEIHRWSRHALDLMLAFARSVEQTGSSRCSGRWPNCWRHSPCRPLAAQFDRLVQLQRGGACCALRVSYGGNFRIGGMRRPVDS